MSEPRYSPVEMIKALAGTNEASASVFGTEAPYRPSGKPANVLKT